MAEIQHAPVTNTALQSQQFIELVMMQAQQAALCLGQMEHPATGKIELNLDAAKMFIDHLEIIKEKTRGNLTVDEEKILTSVLTELQLAFVHVAKEARGGADLTPPAVEESPKNEATPYPEESSASASGEDEGKKKFTKSYGA
jgi:hypothetical protein